VEGFLNQASFNGSTKIFSIGPTTTAAVVAAGLTVSGEAAQPDLDSLVEAMQ
jgi:uroporphyrinogen-III synthase